MRGGGNDAGPILSVVIPSYNGRHLLEDCLASVARCLPGSVSVEVIVVDDASTDDTADWMARAYPRFRCVALAANGGFVAAANAGIAAARGQFIQLLNNDTEVTPGWVEAGLEPFYGDEKVGSVAPLVLCRGDQTRVDSAGDRFTVIGWPCKRGHGEPATKWMAHAADRVFGASGSSAFYRAEALRRVGGYDPAYGSYYEDVDLAFRLRWAGYDCRYAPGCRILHDVSASYNHQRAELQRRMSRNAEFLFWTNLPAGWLAAALLPRAGFAMAQAGHRLLRGRLRPFLAGKVDAARVWPTIMRGRRLRRELARKAVCRPHFPVTVSPVGDLVNHQRRPG